MASCPEYHRRCPPDSEVCSRVRYVGSFRQLPTDNIMPVEPAVALTPLDLPSILQNALQISLMLNEASGASEKISKLAANVDQFAQVIQAVSLRQRAPDGLQPDARRAILHVLSSCHRCLEPVQKRIKAFEARISGNLGAQAWREHWVVLAWEILGREHQVDRLSVRLADECRLVQTCLALSDSQILANIYPTSRPLTAKRLPILPVASTGWVAGAKIRLDLFGEQEPLHVQLASGRQVSNGASAAVFVAHSGNGLVALKVFGGIMSLEQRLVLQRELRNVRTLSHRYILPYIGSAVHELRTILVSPFMENGDMLAYLRTYRDADQQILIQQVARAVEYLHDDKRLIHGDLKCENVLISPTGHALLADFGLSTFVDNSDTSTTVTGIRMCHTLSFAAPELLLGQISQETIAGRQRARSKSIQTDVYAFGMLVVQAFIRSSPWPGLLAPQIIVNVISGHHHPRPDGMSNLWWEVCGKCWALDPSKRPIIAQVAAFLEM